jgi:hypothetical protein
MAGKSDRSTGNSYQAKILRKQLPNDIEQTGRALGIAHWQFETANRLSSDGKWIKDVDCSQPNSPFELMKHNKELHMNTCTQVKQHAVKLALLSAFAIGAASTVSSAAAVVTNSADAATAATVVKPITITSTSGLVFGTIAPNSSGDAGTITVATNGARTSATQQLLSGGDASQAAHFTIEGEGTSTYTITHSATDLTGAGAPMTLALISSATATAATTGTVSSGTLSAGTQSLYIGGKLTVGANQVAGVYTGAITATVNYN